MSRPTFFLRKLFLAASFFAGVCVLPAQEPQRNPPLKEISPDVFQLGFVQLNKKKKTVEFPASVNMTNGVVEYFLVNGTGKLHESVLKTDVPPSQIHLAMLLIGAKENSASNTNDVIEKKFLTKGNTNNIAGDKISIEVNWKIGGKEKHLSAENFIFNQETKSPMSQGDWIYNGSKIVNGTFIAQRDGSIVSIITDELALANNPRPGHDNDEIWFVNTNSIPVLNTSVEVTFQLKD
jgi:hypothetical protein